MKDPSRYKSLRSTSRSLLNVHLPPLAKKGRVRTTFFKPGEVKQLHTTDVQSKLIRKLLEKGVLVDVTRQEIRKARREEARRATTKKSTPVAEKPKEDKAADKKAEEVKTEKKDDKSPAKDSSSKEKKETKE